MTGDLYVTGDADADALLNGDPNALLIGMLLDQQVPRGWAFRGPHTLRARLGHLDVGRIATTDEDETPAETTEASAGEEQTTNEEPDVDEGAAEEAAADESTEVTQ